LVWARELSKLGHSPRIIASKFVIPYRQNEKNDANDAEAICEAVNRPKTRFVTIKSAEQQAVLTLHRIRQGLIKTVPPPLTSYVEALLLKSMELNQEATI
jgi:transposase